MIKLLIIILLSLINTSIFAEEMLLVKPSSLNIRQEPRLSSKSVSLIKRGDRVLLLEYTNIYEKFDDMRAQWLKVKYNNIIGYAYEPYLIIDRDDNINIDHKTYKNLIGTIYREESELPIQNILGKSGSMLNNDYCISIFADNKAEILSFEKIIRSKNDKKVKYQILDTLAIPNKYSFNHCLYKRYEINEATICIIRKNDRYIFKECELVNHIFAPQIILKFDFQNHKIIIMPKDTKLYCTEVE